MDIDYYVPFTINLGNEKSYTPKTCWRIGNFKNSLMEFSIDEKSGILRDITLTSVNKAHLVNATLENVDIVESGTPVFLLDGNIKNGLCDQVMDFYVYLSMEFIMVNFSEENHPYKFIKLEKVRFGFGKQINLIRVILYGDLYYTDISESELLNQLKLDLISYYLND